MAIKKTISKAETVENIGIGIKFKKASFLDSKKYNHDLINALLKDDTEYTKAEVDKLIDDFMKGKVR